VVLCDAAPKLTGIRDRDRALEEELLLAVEGLVAQLLRPGGDLLVKVLESPEARAIERRISARFERAKALRPEASRPGSSERYLVARGYRGGELKRTQSS
jgi:23S rRNA (uridine2552-2'-O)-methyltransferase